MVVGGLGQEEEEDFVDSDDEEEEDFPANFKEYMENELKCSRLENSNWVFWNRQDGDLTLSYDDSVDSIPDVCASPKIRLNIRHALHKLISYPELRDCLVQFWAPKRTLEGRTLLTTQFQPFALTTSYGSYRRNQLCSYRMGMCREYNNCFYVDAERGEEQLGLPGRVFLNKLPEQAPGVEYYTLKEYPQREFALRCQISESWALPVFEQSSHTCVGVLEIASYFDNYSWADRELFGPWNDIFQEFGLRCFDGYKHCEIQDEDKNKALTTAFQELNMVYESVCKIHDLPLALTWVSCRSCKHLLQSQFPFSVLNDCDEDYDDYSFWLDKFKDVSHVCHLMKGQFTGRILSSPNLLYCSDVKQFHIDEFPLVPFARCCKLGGWFTMCLQSSCTGDELYVLEFFLHRSTKNDENILTKLRLILGTMQKNFKTFKLASGQGLGEALSVEVIDFQYGQRSHSRKMIPATIFIPSLELVQDGGVMLQQAQQDQPSTDAINNVVSEAQNDNLPSLDSLQNEKVTTKVDSSNQPSMDASSNGQNFITAERNIFVVSSSKEHERKTQDRKHKKGGSRIDIPKNEILKCSHMNREDAAGKLRVGISTFKRVCRGHGIDRWPPRNIEKIQPSLPSSGENQRQTPQLNFDFPSNQASGTVANIKTGFQDADTVTIRAKCETNTIKFRLSLSSTLKELQQQVAKRLELQAGTYLIKYEDEKDELILIACDVDLQDCIQSFRSPGNNDIYITLEKKILNSF